MLDTIFEILILSVFGITIIVTDIFTGTSVEGIVLGALLLFGAIGLTVLKYFVKKSKEKKTNDK